MLKFLRKYQLYILAIGGSLLMVAFLLQPILSRLSPSPLKAKVARLADGTSYNRADIEQANTAINVLKRVNPRALASREMGGLGLDETTESSGALHWLLLVRMARQAGLVGEAGDGASWLDNIAEQEAYFQTRTEGQQGKFQTQAQAEQRMAELKPQILEILNRNVALSAGNSRETMDGIYRILAEARGVYRLMSAVRTMPAYSDVSAVHAAHELLDAYAVNAAVLDSGLVGSAIPDPGDDELRSFFDRYRNLRPGEDDYGIGYTQPTRVRIGWLTLDKNVFMNAVPVDLVELQKIYLQNRDKYTGDFPAERFEIERRFREERATDMMVEADMVLRAQVLAKTRGLSKVNGILSLPGDWDENRPRLEAMAQSVVERINERFSVPLPTPEVTIIGDRWLNAQGVSSLPGLGSASYRVGSSQIPAYALPQYFQMTEPNTTGLDVQVGLPLVEPAATDEAGNRYYAVILGVRPAGPADSIEDIGRERVLSDYRSVRGYEMLTERLDEFRAAIVENGSIAPAVDLAMAIGGDTQVKRPGVIRNILVRRDSVGRGALASTVDPRLNTEPFRTAVIEAGSGVDPLASPEQLAQNPVPVVVGVPSARAVALGLLIAPRPLTAEQFRSVGGGVIAQTAQQELMDAGLGEHDPFSYEALVKRYKLVRLKQDDEGGVAPVPGDEATPETDTGTGNGPGNEPAAT